VIVADTHAFVWWVNGSRGLSPRAKTALTEAPEIGLCAISCWEIAMLVARDRLRFDRDVLVWLKQALASPRVRLLPLDPEVAVESARLEWPNGEPADRMIVATARVHRAPIITKDDRIRSLSGATVIW
jgi:PIN domain nuclease of toxin-antitoxin system